MKNIIEICKEFGLEIPEEKQGDFSKRVAENYLTKAEHEKKTGRLEADRDAWQQKAGEAENALKSFEGIDPEQVQAELAQWKKKAEEAQADYAQKLYDRDYADALKTALESVKFSSEAAKKAVAAEIKEAGLKLKDGKILGLSDLLAQIKESDASAFADEQQQQLEASKARFTQPQNAGAPAAPGTKVTPAELMRMKNENPNLDISQYVH